MSGLGLVAAMAVGTADAALVAKQIGAGDTALLFEGAAPHGDLLLPNEPLTRRTKPE